MLVLSLAKPDAGFNVGFAMARNKFIYINSVGTVAVKSDYKKGGTWAGAAEAIKKGYCPVLCRDRKGYRGNEELIKLGAVPIDDTWDGNALAFSVQKKPGTAAQQAPPKAEQLTFFD